MASEVTRGEMVESAATQLASTISAVQIGSDKVVLAAFPADITMQEKIKIFNHVMGKARDISELKSNEMNLESVLIISTQWVGDDGGITDGHKVWLINDEGEAWFTGSDGIAKSIAGAVAFFGTPPWNPPIPVVVLEQQTAKKRRYYTLNVLASSYEKAIKGKSKK